MKVRLVLYSASMMVLGCVGPNLVSTTDAETLILHGGERIEGTVLRSIGGTLSVKLAEIGMRQLSTKMVDKIELTLVSGEKVVGTLVGWSESTYEIKVGNRLLSVRDGQILNDIAIDPEIIIAVESSDSDRGPLFAPDELEGGLEAEDGAASESANDVLPLLTGLTEPTVESAGEAVFRLELSATSGEAIVVIYSTMDRSATSGADYRRAADVLIIEAGAKTMDVKIPLIDDDLAEPDEEFELFLSADPKAVRVRSNHLVTTIRDDDS